MSWKNVKNLLLLLLLAVNLFLGYLTYEYYVEANFTDAVTAKNAAKILEKSGIIISPEMLNVKNESADMLLSDYDRETYICLVASLLFGKEADGTYMLPNGVRAETESGEVALLGYDMSVDFVLNSERDSVLAALENAKVSDSEKSRAAVEFLTGKLALGRQSIAQGACKESGDFVFVTVRQTEEGLRIDGMDAVIGVVGDKIVYASGKLFFGVPNESRSAQLLDRVNILFSEKERGSVGNVTNVELCYALYEEADQSRMLFVPSYVLTYSDGTVHTVNAISKKIY